MSETIRLKIGPNANSSNADSLQFIQGSVEELGQREAWPESLTFKVSLVLEELGLNIMTYGGEGTNHRPEIEIVLKSEEDTLTIEVSDDGHPFNPLQDLEVPNVEALLDDRPIGGLGVHLVRTMMDDLSYERTAGRKPANPGCQERLTGQQYCLCVTHILGYPLLHRETLGPEQLARIATCRREGQDCMASLQWEKGAHEPDE